MVERRVRNVLTSRVLMLETIDPDLMCEVKTSNYVANAKAKSSHLVISITVESIYMQAQNREIRRLD